MPACCKRRASTPPEIILECKVPRLSNDVARADTRTPAPLSREEPTQLSTLRTIPPELRIEILKLVLVKRITRVSHLRRQNTPTLRRLLGRCRPSKYFPRPPDRLHKEDEKDAQFLTLEKVFRRAVLYTCRQLYKEGSAIFYQYNQFHFFGESLLQRFFQKIGPTSCACITAIHVDCGPAHHATGRFWCADMPKGTMTSLSKPLEIIGLSCPNLKKLQLVKGPHSFLCLEPPLVAQLPDLFPNLERLDLRSGDCEYFHSTWIGSTLRRLNRKRLKDRDYYSHGPRHDSPEWKTFSLDWERTEMAEVEKVVAIILATIAAKKRGDTKVWQTPFKIGRRKNCLRLVASPIKLEAALGRHCF